MERIILRQILVVDDDPMLAIEACVQRQGFGVADGAQARMQALEFANAGTASSDVLRTTPEFAAVSCPPKPFRPEALLAAVKPCSGAAASPNHLK
jgi:hypothetical protein